MRVAEGEGLVGWEQRRHYGYVFNQPTTCIAGCIRRFVGAVRSPRRGRCPLVHVLSAEIAESDAKRVTTTTVVHGAMRRMAATTPT